MSLLALVAALLLEYYRPFTSRHYLYNQFVRYVDFFQHYLNAGKPLHGKLAWLFVVLPLAMLMVALSALLHRTHPIFSWIFSVAVLYFTLSFRRFRLGYYDIRKALRTNKLNEARELLTAWRGKSAQGFNSEVVSRVAIEELLIASHRNVFSVIMWFALFSMAGLGGAAGALLYRLSQFLYTHWADRKEPEYAEFGLFARQAFCFLEWLPVRITALTFAIVGNFEDTIFCWRTQAANWSEREIGIVLASGAGSLGVRLGMSLTQDNTTLERAELGIGEAVDTDFMQSAVGLIWRSVAFMLIVLLLLTMVNVLN